MNGPYDIQALSYLDKGYLVAKTLWTSNPALENKSMVSNVIDKGPA